jgi:hypothetical protein
MPAPERARLTAEEIDAVPCIGTGNDFCHYEDIVQAAANKAWDMAMVDVRALLKELVEEAKATAYSACSERCVHSLDQPEDCPKNHPVFDRVKAFMPSGESLLD